MKKVILFVFLLAMGIGAMAQSIQSYSFTADTLTNGDTAYLAAPVLHADWNFNYVVIMDSLTGTTALTTAMEVSNDGSTWVVDSAFTQHTLAASAGFPYKGKAYGKYYRARVIQTGTATTSVYGTLIIKKSVVIAQ